MRRKTQAALWASCLVIGIGVHDAVQARDRTVGVSVGGKNGINANVSLGTRNGVDADVSASVGGRKGINANVDANVGDSVDANVDASVGTRKGIDADTDVSVGDQGVDANVDVNVDGPGTNVRRPDVVDPTDPDITDSNPKPEPEGTTLTPTQRLAFDGMPDGQKKAILKRCLSVGADGYDAALVNLCKLLRMSASR